MNITIYLPDDLGQQAKAAELPLSQMLRAAVIDELRRREAMEQMLEGEQVKAYQVDLYSADGEQYVGRITGACLCDSIDCQVYLAEDERVLLYDSDKAEVCELTDPVEELRDWLSEEDYISVLYAIGEVAVVDI